MRWGQRCDGAECRGAQIHAGIEAVQARIKRQLTMRFALPLTTFAPGKTGALSV